MVQSVLHCMYVHVLIKPISHIHTYNRYIYAYRSAYRFVDDGEIGDVRRVLHDIRIGLLQIRNEHAELRAPVAHMVHPQHLEAHELEHPAQTIPCSAPHIDIVKPHIQSYIHTYK